MSTLDLVRRLRWSVALLASAVALAACTPRTDTHGHVPKPDALARIQPGLQTRAEVAQMLGTPTSIGTLDGERWYYLTRVTENLAFYDPKQIDQRVVVIEFDGNDRVKDVHSYSVDEARRIEIVDRETPTQGKDLSLLKQLFGNIGRFERPNTGN